MHSRLQWLRSVQYTYVATPILGCISPRNIEDMNKESEKMMQFNHANVMTLIGLCTDVGEAPYIVMPFMANGSLLAYLRKNRPHLNIAEEAGSIMVHYSSK